MLKNKSHQGLVTLRVKTLRSLMLSQERANQTYNLYFTESQIIYTFPTCYWLYFVLFCFYGKLITAEGSWEDWKLSTRWKVYWRDFLQRNILADKVNTNDSFTCQNIYKKYPNGFAEALSIVLYDHDARCAGKKKIATMKRIYLMFLKVHTLNNLITDPLSHKIVLTAYQPALNFSESLALLYMSNRMQIPRLTAIKQSKDHKALSNFFLRTSENHF